MKGRFVTGIIGAPYGLEGFVKVRPLSGETDHLLNLKSVILRKNGKEKLLEIEESKTIQASVFFRFKGYSDQDDAKTLNGSELMVDRNNAAVLQPGEYYIEDLRGLAVISDGCTLGHIISVFEGGGGDLVEICLNNGEKKLVPFRNDFLSEINLEKGSVLIKNLWILE